MGNTLATALRFARDTISDSVSHVVRLLGLGYAAPAREARAALIPLAIAGNAASFRATPNLPTRVREIDRQGNNVLHGLFSAGNPSAGHVEILEHARKVMGEEGFADALAARNDLGCNVLWIGVAYQCVELLEKLRGAVDGSELKRLASVRNRQGATSFESAVAHPLEREQVTRESWPHAAEEARRASSG